MNIDKNIEDLDLILRNLSEYEKKGLDTSSLKLFIRNLKTFNKVQKSRENRYLSNITLEDKLDLIRSFLEDKIVFPKIKDVIDFSNNILGLNFRDQKESRSLTIQRIIKRIEKDPQLKNNIKDAVKDLVKSNAGYKKSEGGNGKSDIESYSKWAEVLSNL